MTERRILMHIGTHKTGTTSFQACLRRNLKPLKAQGYYVFREKVNRAGAQTRARFNVGPFAHQFLRSELVTRPRLDNVPGVENGAEHRRRRIERVAHRLANNPSRDVIISTEVFCYARTPEEAAELARFFDLTGRRPEIFVTFREEASWRKSWGVQMRNYTELLKSHPPIDEAQDTRADWYYDRAEIETFWRALAPLHVLNFETDRDENGDLSGRLFAEMGVETSGMQLDIRKNVTANKLTP